MLKKYKFIIIFISSIPLCIFWLCLSVYVFIGLILYFSSESSIRPINNDILDKMKIKLPTDSKVLFYSYFNRYDYPYTWILVSKDSFLLPNTLDSFFEIYPLKDSYRMEKLCLSAYSKDDEYKINEQDIFFECGYLWNTIVKKQIFTTRAFYVKTKKYHYIFLQFKEEFENEKLKTAKELEILQ